MGGPAPAVHAACFPACGCAPHTSRTIQAEAWAALFTQLDERVKAKRCGADDVHRAVCLLTARQRRALSGITRSAPASELPSKLLAGSEGLEAVRAALHAAAAAFLEVLPPPPSTPLAGCGGGADGSSSGCSDGRGAAEWRARGFSVREALEAGA
jgi:hypothetical protein